jgi:hypothetical protein
VKLLSNYATYERISKGLQDCTLENGIFSLCSRHHTILSLMICVHYNITTNCFVGAINEWDESMDMAAWWAKVQLTQDEHRSTKFSEL